MRVREREREHIKTVSYRCTDVETRRYTHHPRERTTRTRANRSGQRTRQTKILRLLPLELHPDLPRSVIIVHVRASNIIIQHPTLSIILQFRLDVNIVCRLVVSDIVLMQVRGAGTGVRTNVSRVARRSCVYVQLNIALHVPERLGVHLKREIVISVRTKQLGRYDQIRNNNGSKMKTSAVEAV